MRFQKTVWLCLAVTSLSLPVFADVAVASFTPSHPSPQRIGTSIVWKATGTDTGAGPLTFQFNVAPPNGSYAMVKDFMVGTLSNGTWTAKPFIWYPTGVEGTYKIQVVVKDFAANKTGSYTASFKVTSPLKNNAPLVKATSNPLVALFVAPACASGSTIAVTFQDQGAVHPATTTNRVPCHPPYTTSFEIAGMYPSTTYTMYTEVKTGGTITDGPPQTFTTGAPPATLRLPAFKVDVAGSDSANPVIIHGDVQTTGGKPYVQAATDLSGNIIWYYHPPDLTGAALITRPLANGNFLTLQDDYAWNPSVSKAQFLRQIDLAGNIVHETNIGVIQQELLAKGAVDGGPCSAFKSPAPVGSGCIGNFHHDAVESLPNGYTAVLVDIERIYPAGTQGDPSSDPVDIQGDMIIVLDQNWQVFWYWDAFNPDGSGDANGYAKLPVSYAAPLGETCGLTSQGCPPMQLLGTGIAPLAHDWLHANAIYYWPAPENGGAKGDIIVSLRDVDSVLRIDYQDGAGTKDILWRMGPPDNFPAPGDFTIQNTFNDRWPWFSHQHDVGIENGGTGPMTIFDNGNTRTHAAPFGLGSKCGPHDCNNRGMAVTFSEQTWTVTPTFSVDLGYYSAGNGSAQLLADGNYFFVSGLVLGINVTHSHSLELGPTPDSGAASVTLDLEGEEQYRGWQVPNLYSPPVT